MGKLKNRAMSFLSDESGAEITEFAIVLAVVAGLIVVVFVIRNAISDKVNEASSAIEEIPIEDIKDGTKGT